VQRVSLREYAKKHKLSFFNVMKMVRSGEVKSEMVMEEGKEVWYVLVDAKQEEAVAQKIQAHANQPQTPQEEIAQLKAEIERLRSALEACEKSKNK